MSGDVRKSKTSADRAASDLIPADALRALAIHARLEHLRGVRHWWDPELGAGLRELVRAIGPGTSPRASAKIESRAPAKNPSRSAVTSDSPAPVAVTSDSPAPVARTNGSPVRSGTGMNGEGAKIPSSSASAARPGPPWPMPPIAIGRDSDWQERLQAVASRAGACIACDLCKTRTKVAFGVGSAHVPLVFVGEAPGADEDRLGIPFVGKAGQLLTRIIGAIGLDRDEVYICNVLKCRPPGNRNPAPDEIIQCTPFLHEQMEILKPKVICTLGLFASQFLLETKVPIGKLRGRVFEYHGIPVIPTYHPAALLRDPSLKAAVWEDVQLVRRTLDA